MIKSFFTVTQFKIQNVITDPNVRVDKPHNNVACLLKARTVKPA
jgi:hypothetical protein